MALLEEIANHVRRRDLREALVDRAPAPRPGAEIGDPVEAAASAGPGPGAS